METGDPRQGAFSAEKFRDGIKFAMRMGLPDTESERITFQWTSENTWALADARKRPYDFTAAPDSTVSAPDIPASLTVPATVEFFETRSTSGETTVGNFDSTKLKVTILDDEYAIITDMNLGLPDKATVDGDLYTVDFIAPPVGLFDVTVYTIYLSAVDES